jgi:hypothetical protein
LAVVLVAAGLELADFLLVLHPVEILHLVRPQPMVERQVVPA